MQEQLSAAQAEHQPFAWLLNCSRIAAPFSGVRASRYVDPAALMRAGTPNSSSVPVVKLAEEDILCLRSPVPESLALMIRIGRVFRFAIQNSQFPTTSEIDRLALRSLAKEAQCELF
jgi:hypothetical protein